MPFLQYIFLQLSFNTISLSHYLRGFYQYLSTDAPGQLRGEAPKHPDEAVGRGGTPRA